jgi:hypothetical protein
MSNVVSLATYRAKKLAGKRLFDQIKNAPEENVLNILSEMSRLLLLLEQFFRVALSCLPERI